jgi:L,D-peptidoglycan transpeptidase YkuD (ErfK/YbiS/YcfS/YnhG family)
MDREGGSLRAVLGPFMAVIGRNGFARPGQKREGDGKTPSGTFPVEHAFGYTAETATGLVYRRIYDDDVWVDDPESADYNTWTKRALTAASSWEEMKRDDGLYRRGAVIGYNRDPVVKGHGSAIFFHAWKGRNVPTSGCVAVAEADLVALLSWLDSSLKPFFLMG